MLHKVLAKVKLPSKYKSSQYLELTLSKAVFCTFDQSSFAWRYTFFTKSTGLDESVIHLLESSGSVHANCAYTPEKNIHHNSTNDAMTK